LQDNSPGLREEYSKPEDKNQMVFSTIATTGSNLPRTLSSEGSGETRRPETRGEKMKLHGD